MWALVISITCIIRMFLNISEALSRHIYSILLNLLMYFCIYDDFMSGIFMDALRYWVGYSNSLAIVRSGVQWLPTKGNSQIDERRGVTQPSSDQAHRLEKK